MQAHILATLWIERRHDHRRAAGALMLGSSTLTGAIDRMERGGPAARAAGRGRPPRLPPGAGRRGRPRSRRAPGDARPRPRTTASAASAPPSGATCRAARQGARAVHHARRTMTTTTDARRRRVPRRRARARPAARRGARALAPVAVARLPRRCRPSALAAARRSPPPSSSRGRTLATRSSSPPRVLGVAGAQHGLAVLAHEGGALPPLSRRAGSTTSSASSARAPLGLSMLTYRVIHRIHHNHLYEPIDPDLALMAGYPRGRALPLAQARSRI